MKTRWIEFIVLTAIYLFVLITIIHDTIRDVNVQYAFLSRSFAVYGTIIVYLLYVYPTFLLKQRMVPWMLLTIGIFLAQNLILIGIHNWHPLPKHKDLPPFALSSMTFLGLLTYTAFKIAITRLTRISKDNTIYSKILKEYLTASYISLAILLLVFQVNEMIATLTALSILFGYTLYAIHSYFLLPYLEKGHITKMISIVLSFLINVLCTILYASLMELIVRIIKNNSFDGFQILICAVLGLLLTPVIYMHYFHQNKQKRQVHTLRKELGQTAADLKFLQSQVNPHFLFNVMNTLYGIALQEDAQRTASGIEKLSGMMRFMIHENQQNYILLSRELEYLNEYIELQKLRIVNIPSIKIAHNLPQQSLDKLYIAPMLLIPFIENAFKHGISINNPSWIRLQLNIDQQTLKFHVYNSIHHGSGGEDLERSKSGVGLENVKNRLELLYPGRYQLHIEETNNEFFVCLTLQLTDSY